MTMTTPDVIDRLRRTFAPPEFGHIVEFERVDFLAVGAWRSKRYDVTGCEVKVSRSDWRKELRTPEKGDHGRGFCDFWCVAAPAGLIAPGEVPAGWGLLEVDGRGCVTTVRPKRLRERWNGNGSPLRPTPEYAARYTFAMAARRWAYSDADRRALEAFAVAEHGQPRVNGILDPAAIATGRLTSIERHANGEYAREQREQSRAWRAHVKHSTSELPTAGCDYCPTSAEAWERARARALRVLG